MDWLQVLSSAAIGSLLGLLAKEGIDWLKSERVHRLELQRRYFDAKLDATIRTIRQIKTATSTLRSFTKMVKENEESGGWIHPALLSGMQQTFGRAAEKVNEDAAGMLALLGFYYDEDLQRLAEAGGGPPTVLLQKLSEFMWHAEKAGEARRALDQPSPPPAVAKAVFAKVVAFHDEHMKASVGDLAKLADTLDDLANAVVHRMRQDYRGIHF